MFGYVKTKTSELRLRDWECYRAYYCGLCRAMGGCTGQVSRLSLNYDYVFLSVVRCSLCGETPELRRVRCLLHPTKKRSIVTASPQLAYCADVSALLTYHKCADDLADERGLKRLRARVAKLGFGHAYRKAKKRRPLLNETIRDSLKRLADYERSGAEPSADVPAAIFGDLMQAVFADGLDGTAKRIAAEIGKHVGRWIYLADAADDFAQDRKKHRFNPYLNLFGADPTPEDWESVRLAMTATLADAERAFLLMDSFACPEAREILSNILYLGMPETVRRILCPSIDQKGERKR